MAAFLKAQTMPRKFQGPEDQNKGPSLHGPHPESQAETCHPREREGGEILEIWRGLQGPTKVTVDVDPQADSVSEMSWGLRAPPSAPLEGAGGLGGAHLTQDQDQRRQEQDGEEQEESDPGAEVSPLT